MSARPSDTDDVEEDRDAEEAPRPRVVAPSRGMRKPAQIFGLIAETTLEPIPIVRLELLRILLPLAILGFMSSRLAHADEWIGDTGFRVPDMGGDWRQPLYIAPLPVWGAWTLAAVMVASGLSVVIGFRARLSAFVFAMTLAFVALSDRLSAFTVSKTSPVLMLVLAASPIGTRYGLDAIRKFRANPSAPRPDHAIGGVRFFQAFLPVMYCASGIAKARGDWLTNPLVMWTHLHDSYQTPFTVALTSALPAIVWTAFQIITLTLEAGALLWFAWPKTRSLAFLTAFTMHVLIALMFGPVKWFAMLMGSMLLGAYLPDAYMTRIEGWLSKLEPPTRTQTKKKKKKPLSERAA
jgi:uncharacterized membrane protein YphA (DoxX/SURF4 family)